jgi:hypothetical protein
MRNEVVGYEAGRRLAWEPARVAASAEEQEAIGGPARYRWGYEFSPDGPGATLVTESFDCSRSPQDLREAVRGRRGVAGRHDRVAGQAGTPGQGRRPAQPVGRQATSSPCTRARLPPDRCRGRRRAGAARGSNAPAWVRAGPGWADRRLPDHLRPGPFTYPEQPTMRAARAVSSGPVARPDRRQCARRHAEYRSRSVIARGGGRARHRGAGRGYQEKQRPLLRQASISVPVDCDAGYLARVIRPIGSAFPGEAPGRSGRAGHWRPGW